MARCGSQPRPADQWARDPWRRMPGAAAGERSSAASSTGWPASGVQASAVCWLPARRVQDERAVMRVPEVEHAVQGGGAGAGRLVAEASEPPVDGHGESRTTRPADQQENGHGNECKRTPVRRSDERNDRRQPSGRRARQPRARQQGEPGMAARPSPAPADPARAVPQPAGCRHREHHPQHSAANAGPGAACGHQLAAVDHRCLHAVFSRLC